MCFTSIILHGVGDLELEPIPTDRGRGWVQIHPGQSSRPGVWNLEPWSWKKETKTFLVFSNTSTASNTSKSHLPVVKQLELLMGLVLQEYKTCYKVSQLFQKGGIWTHMHCCQMCYPYCATANELRGTSVLLLGKTTHTFQHHQFCTARTEPGHKLRTNICITADIQITTTVYRTGKQLKHAFNNFYFFKLPNSSVQSANQT